MAALAITGVSVAGLAGGGNATATTPGQPGTPQPPTTLYSENFENDMGTSQVLLNAYTGATGETYTADNGWLTGCNGEIVEFNTPYTDLGNCANTGDTSNTRQLAYGLGVQGGAATPATNHAVTAYTDGNPGANAIEFATVNPISLPSATGRYLTFSVDAAAVNCPPVASAPAYQFYLMNGTTPTAVGGQINACTSTQTASAPAVGTLPAQSVKVGTYTSNGSVLFTGSALGIRMTNANGSGGGNDAAFDNIKILDVTPQLDKSFSPASVQVGQTSTLTFTITNTSELAAKNGWSFTDTLPAGLTVTSPAASTTCPSGTVTAPAGSSTVNVSGNLNAGMASCTVTVNVTAGTAGSYTNGPSNVSETGLNTPGSTTVTFTAPTVSCATDPNVFNTGYDAATGGELPNGSSDPRWMVAGGYPGFYYPNGTSPATATPLPPADAVFVPGQVGNSAPSAWAPSPYGNAQWISADYNGAGGQNQEGPPAGTGPNGPANGDWYYQYQFNLDPAVDPASFALHIGWLADNTVASVWVNGAQKYLGPSTNPYLGGNFTQGTSISTLLNSGWRTGLNTILVEVKSYYTDEGFNAQVQPSALCPSVTVTKNVAGRVRAADQFTVSVQDSGGAALTSATTSGAQTSVTSDPAYLQMGSTYTITDAMAAGSSSPLSDYNAKLVCTDTTTNQTIPVTGNGPTWSFTPTAPDKYSCAVTNTGAAQAYTVTKTSSATGPVHPGDTITYTVTVKNSTLIPYTAAAPATFTDNLSGVLDDAAYNNDATSGASVNGSTLSWSGPLAAAGSPGDTATVTYSVTVDNPDVGDKQLKNKVVGGTNCPAGSTDPACSTSTPVQSFRVVKTTTATEVTPGATVPYTVTITNTGQADYTAADPASFTDDLSNVLDDAAYNADASATGGTVSYTAPTLSWTGPLPVGATVTLTYTVTVNDPDGGDQHLDNTLVTPANSGGNCADGSTDPACSAHVPAKSFSTVKTASEQAADPGDTVTYTITVTNTGQADYTGDEPASFTDDLTGALDDASYDGDATATAGTVSYSAPKLSWSGALAVGATVTVTYSVKVDSPDGGDQLLRNAVTNPAGSGGGCVPGSTDPACRTSTPVRSFHVAKTASQASAKPGDTVTYTITVTNTGQADYTATDPASFTDDLSGVLDDAAYNGDASATAGTVSYTAPTVSWTGALAVGATVTVTYSVSVDDPDAGDQTLTNTVVTPPGGNCPTGSSDPDCGTNTPEQAYTVTKRASVATARAGDTVTYTVTVTNTGKAAYTASDPASFSDDLTGVLDDASYNDDATAGATYRAPNLSWSGALPVGATVTVTYSVTVDNPDNGDQTLTNTVVTPEGNCQTGSTDPACGTTTPVQQFTVAKTASATTATPGDTVTYTVTVTNTGQAAYTASDPASFTDNLAQVLDDAGYNNDATASDGTASYAAPVLSWSGPLPIGATVTVTYSATVDTPDTGDHDLANAIVTPRDGGCPTGSTDPTCHTDTPVQDYSVVKTSAATTVTPGEKVTYKIVVTNTGKVDYTAAAPASFTDDLSEVLDDATYDNDANSGATYQAPTLSWSDALPVGASVTVTYSVTVNSPDAGDHVLDNTVVTPPGGPCPAGSTDPRCSVTIPGPVLHVVKTASTASADPGQKITYTIRVSNTGGGDFTTAKPAGFTDDLSKILDDAAYNHDASGGATYQAPKLSWSGALAAGATKTITYSVTVKSPDPGDKLLPNTVVVPPGTPSNCTSGSTDPDCSTLSKVAAYTVKKTASSAKVKPGDTVTYTIVVTNTGQVAYTTAHPARFTDDLTAVLDDATYNDDATHGATYSAPKLTWSGALPVGGTVSITYSVTVHDPDHGDGKLHNVVTTPNDPSGRNAANCPPDTSDPTCQTQTGVEAATATSPSGTAYTGNDTALQLTVGLLALGLGGLMLLLAGFRRRRS